MRVFVYECTTFSSGFVRANMKDKKGFICVNDTLQTVTAANVFASGDCCTLSSQPTGFPPKAGVYAVRGGVVLLSNILSILQHQYRNLKTVRGKPGTAADALSIIDRIQDTKLQEFKPQAGFLTLLMTADRRAIGAKFGIAFRYAVFLYVSVCVCMCFVCLSMTVCVCLCVCMRCVYVHCVCYVCMSLCIVDAVLIMASSTHYPILMQKHI